MISIVELKPSGGQDLVLASKCTSGQCFAETFHSTVLGHPLFDMSIGIEVFQIASLWPVAALCQIIGQLIGDFALVRIISNYPDIFASE